MIDTIVISIIGAGLVALWIGTERRHGRIRARLARLESRHRALRTEHLRAMRPLYADRAASDLAARGGRLCLDIAFRAEFGEDMLLYELFRGQREGFYIEVGAFDGVTNAVSYIFEAIGWTGLLVEPIPECAEAARSARPGSRVVHSAVSRRGAGDTITLAVYDDEVGLGSHVADAPHVRPMKRPRVSAARTVRVPLATLSDLLAGHDRPIDFAVIDVEGHETDVLDGLDLERHRPRAMIVEDHSLGADRRLTQALEQAGYALAGWISYNRVAIRRDEPELLKRFAALQGIADPGPPHGVTAPSG